MVAIDAGYYYSLALTADGTVVAWGLNNLLQLGNDTMDKSLVPVALATSGELANKTVVAIAAGGAYNLALCSDGTIAAWGWGERGRLGNGSTTNSSVPVLVTATTGALTNKKAVAIAAGYDTSLALCSDGTLAAWGSDSFQQLGDGSGPASGYSSTPVAVTPPGTSHNQPIVAMAAGTYFTLAAAAAVQVAPTQPPPHSLQIAVESEIASVGLRQSSDASPRYRVRLTVQSQANRPHAIQYKDHLSEPTWKHLHRANTDANGIMEHIHSMPDGTSPRFYRSIQE